MRILFTAMSGNIHVARWISQIQGLGWDIHVFGDTPGVYPTLTDVTVYKPTPRGETTPEGTRIEYWWPFTRGEYLLRVRLGDLGRRLFPHTPNRLAQIIQKIKPDIIHTLKMQTFGYEVDEARKLLGGQLPCPWVYTSWGRDTHVYRYKPDHLPRIQSALSHINYYISDTQRDILIAFELGFKGEVLGVFPGPGGFDIDRMLAYRTPGKSSDRRIIALKGYQTDDGGQVLMALAGIRCVTDLLKDYKVVVHGAIGTYASKNFELVKRAADEITAESGVEIEFLPFVPHEQIWELFGKARIAMSISRSDGTPATMLEWLIMGAYPIESDTGGPAEWLTSGVNGETAPYDDAEKIAAALRRGLQDDDLVDRAAELNLKISRERLDAKVLTPQVIEMYRRVAAENVNRSSSIVAR